MKSLIIYNKKSGLWKGFNLPKIAQKTLTQYGSVELFELTDWSGAIFQKFADKKFDLIVAIGGDGTIRTCATLILDYQPKAKLKIVPAGSSNILASSLGLSLSSLVALKKLENIKFSSSIKIDVGELKQSQQKKYFLITAIFGYVAEIINQTDQKLKNKIGFGGYIFTFFKKNKPGSYRFQLTVNNKKKTLRASSLFVVNALNVFGLTPQTKSDFSDGVFEILYAQYKNFWQFIASLWHFFVSTKKIGRLAGSQITITQTNQKKLAPLQIDGDLIENRGGDCQIKVLPQALTIIV